MSECADRLEAHMPLTYAALVSLLLLVGCSSSRPTTEAHHPGTGAKTADDAPKDACGGAVDACAKSSSPSAAFEYNGSVTLVRVK